MAEATKVPCAQPGSEAPQIRTFSPHLYSPSDDHLRVKGQKQVDLC